MNVIVRTIYGIAVQTAQNLKIKLEIPQNSTINEVMSDSEVVPFQPNPPTLGMMMAEEYDMETDSANIVEQLICIGNKGHRASVDATYGIDGVDLVPHIATDAGLYGMIPFVIRPYNDDLSPSIAKNYRLRKTLWINNELYVAYYARKLNVESVVPEMTIVDVSNGIEQSRPFVPTINDLKPKPRTIDGEGDGSYVESLANVDVNFTEQEVNWLAEVGTIFFGDPNKGLISEIAFCSCVDKPVTRRYNPSGTQTPITVPAGERYEAVAVQVNCFVSTFLTTNLNGGFGGTYNLGGYDPLYSNVTGS